jgi:protoporphyrinogen/coproporphyrinogen III oxidase
MRTVAIIGGGLAGLSCAHALRERGIPCTVFEASEPGGRCPGATFLLGPDVYKNTFRLAASLGLRDDIIAIPPIAGQYYKGRVYHHRVSSVLGLLSFKGLNLIDKAMLSRMAFLLARYGPMLDFQHPERAAPIDDESVATFVKRELTQNILNYVAGPLISTLFFYGSEETSKVLYLNLAKHMQHTTLYTIRGGLTRLASALATELRIRQTRVDSITQVDGAYVVAGNRFTDVVIAVPGNAVLQIGGMRDLLSREDCEFFAQCRYGGAITVSVNVDGFRGDCYALSIPRVEKLSAATINFNDFIDPATVHTGNITIVGGDSVSASDLLKDFQRIYSREPKDATVREWTAAMPKFPPGRYRDIAAFLNRQRRPGLFFCGDYLLGPFAEGAIATGLRAVPL